MSHCQVSSACKLMAQQQQAASLPEDIRPKLEIALSTELDFVGAFSYSETHINTPNPSLKIHELGAVGIPLSSRDAEAIKWKARQAPFGLGEKTAVDEGAKLTWEIDARMVAFTNPQWWDFIYTSIERACMVLGVNYSASRPRCEPYKLLLNEAGSFSLPCISTRKADGMFATVLMILPSEYTGGEAHLSHNGVGITYDCSHASFHTTTVMAWYTDVMREVKPIKSGYQFAISFNLIHTTTSLPPAISTNSAFIEGVKKVLLSWKEMSGISVPRKIVYLLDHSPSIPNLRGCPIKTLYDPKVFFLQQVCKEVEFSLGMATVVCRLSGSVEDDRDSESESDDDEYGWGSRAHANKNERDKEDSELEFSDIEEREVTIEDLLTLDGATIATVLGINEDTETIPFDLSDSVEDEDHDDQNFDSYMGNGSGRLERWYNRSALVIWPDKNVYDVLYSGYPVENVFEKLQEASGPSNYSTQLAEYVLSRLSGSPPTAFKAVCNAALRWKDYSLWCHLVGTHMWRNHASLLDCCDLKDSIETFGFQEVCKSLEQAFLVSPTNRGLLEIITQIMEMFQGNPELEEACGKEAVSSWVFKQRDNALRNLKKFHKDDVEGVIQSSISHGGPMFLKECVVPQLVPKVDSKTLVKLALEINKSAIEDTSTKMELISKLAVTAVRKFDFFPNTPPPKLNQTPSGSTPKSTVTTDPIMKPFKKFILSCCTLGCVDALVLILEKAMPPTTLSPEDATKCARTVMLPLLDYIRVKSCALPGMFPERSVKALAEAAIPLILSRPDEINGALIRSMVNAVKMTGGGLDMIQTSIVPNILALKASPDSQFVLAEEIMKLRPSLSEGIENEDFDSKVRLIITSLTSKVAHDVRLNSSTIINVLGRFGKLRAGEGRTIITKRVINSVLKANATQLQKNFVPLLTPFRKLALSNPDLEPDTNTLLRTIVQRWCKEIDN